MRLGLCCLEIEGGKWLAETAELVGHRRADIDALKALLARTHDAAREQAAVTTIDPYRETLADHINGIEGKIASESIWTILDVKPGARGQEQSRRVGDAMRSLGWSRANTAGTVKIQGRLVAGWVKGPKPWKSWEALRLNGVLNVSETD
jgi:hypothetical protein